MEPSDDHTMVLSLTKYGYSKPHYHHILTLSLPCKPYILRTKHTHFIHMTSRITQGKGAENPLHRGPYWPDGVEAKGMERRSVRRDTGSWFSGMFWEKKWRSGFITMLSSGEV